LLHDVLYQDKDYEIAYLSNGTGPGRGVGLGLGSLLP
jgi:hypothetical protein